MKLGVFGSRSLSDARVKTQLAQFLTEHPDYNAIVTTQEPKGVCSVAQRYAKENSLVLELHFLNIKKYARGAFEHRSDAVIKSADFLMVIHDGESKGTANELARIKHFKKPFDYIKLEKTTTLEVSENLDIFKDQEEINNFLDGGSAVIPKKTIAVMCDITARRVEQLAQQKIIPKVGKGVFDLVPTVQAYTRYLHGIIGGGISADKSELNQRLLQAQTEEREAKAALRQLELDQKQGSSITIEEVKRQWSARLIEFKAAMLEMPKQAAFRFTDADIRIHVEEELSAFVVEVLARYSRGGIRAVVDGNNATDPETAAADNGQPMGRRKPNSKRKGKSAARAVEDKPDAISP